MFKSGIAASRDHSIFNVWSTLQIVCQGSHPTVPAHLPPSTPAHDGHRRAALDAVADVQTANGSAPPLGEERLRRPSALCSPCVQSPSPGARPAPHSVQAQPLHRSRCFLVTFTLLWIVSHPPNLSCCPSPTPASQFVPSLVSCNPEAGARVAVLSLSFAPGRCWLVSGGICGCHTGEGCFSAPYNGAQGSPGLQRHPTPTSAGTPQSGDPLRSGLRAHQLARASAGPHFGPLVEGCL